MQKIKVANYSGNNKLSNLISPEPIFNGLLKDSLHNPYTEMENDAEIKFGEFLLKRKPFSIKFGCTYCGEELDKLHPFLLHSLSHYLSGNEDDINSIIKQADYCFRDEIPVTNETQGNEHELLVSIEQKEPDVDVCANIEEMTYVENAKDEFYEALPILETLNEVVVIDEEETLFEFHDTGDGSIKHGAELQTSKAPVGSVEIKQIASVSAESQQPTLYFAKTEIDNRLKEFKCLICLKSFKDAHYLKLHERKHAKINKLSCEYCGKIFTERGKYKTHIKRHKSSNSHKCSQCDKSFLLVKELKKHKLLHIDSEETIRFYLCTECGRSFKNASLLSSHRRRHTNERPFNCEKCGACFYEKYMLQRHQITHTRNKVQNFRRENLKLFVSNVEDLKNNQIIERMMPEEEIYRQELQKISTKESSCHSTENSKSVEPKQQFEVSTKSRDNKEVFEYKCNICSKTFKKKYYLTVHKRRHDNQKSFACEYCGKTFPDSANLGTHVKRHLGIKAHKCTLCDKSFVVLPELRIHMRSHTGECPYSCQQCDRSFKTASLLASHRRRHTNERPYKCETCGKSFFEKGTLKNHLVVHTGESPFPCTKCDMKFTQKVSLNEHMKLHSDAKNHVCKICGEAFKQVISLYRHKKNHDKKL